MTTEVELGDEIGDIWQSARTQSAKLAGELAKMEGFPIRTESLTPVGTVVTTVITVRKEDIPETFFEVPSDY